jgi:streptogramin lyase
MRIWTRALLTAAAVLALVPAGAMAAPTLDPTAYTPSNTPGHITGGPDGNAWFAIAGGAGGKEYGKITPAGTITEFDTPTDGRVLADVTSGPNGHVWFSYTDGVLEVDPATGTGVEHPLVGQLPAPKGIAADADGNLWAVAADKVVKISSAGVKLSDSQLGLAPVGPSGRDIVLGSDNRLYLANFGTQTVLAFSPASPDTPQTIAVAPEGPQELASGPGQVGVSVPSNVVGRISTAGVFTPTTATLSDTTGLAYGRDEAFWGAEFGINKVGRTSAVDGTHTAQFDLPAGSGPRYIAAVTDGTIFVTAETSKKLHRITGIEAPPAPVTPDPGTGTDPGTGPGTGPTGPTVTPDTAAPLVSRAKVDTKKRRLTITLDEPATLNLTIQQKVKRGKKSVYKRIRPVIKKQGKAGANTISLGKKFKKGTYRVQVTATDVLGNKTAKPKTVGFKVK